MDPYNNQFYPDSSRNYSRQHTPLTNQYIHDDVSEHLRVSSPFSQDFFQQNLGQNVSNLRKQLNDEMKRHNVLLQQVSNLQYQNQQIKRNQYNSAQTNALRQQNQRLRLEIERKRQMSNVPQQLIDELSELRRQNNWLRQNAANLNQKNQRY